MCMILPSKMMHNLATHFIEQNVQFTIENRNVQLNENNTKTPVIMLQDLILLILAWHPMLCKILCVVLANSKLWSCLPVFLFIFHAFCICFHLFHVKLISI